MVFGVHVGVDRHRWHVTVGAVGRVFRLAGFRGGTCPCIVGFGNHWITVKLVGKRSNRMGVGARIRIEIKEAGTRRSVYKWVNSGGSFGANPLRQEMGLGQANSIELLEVFWPTSGQIQRFRDVALDQFIEITEGQNEYRKLPWKTIKLPAHRRPQPTAAEKDDQPSELPPDGDR